MNNPFTCSGDPIFPNSLNSESKTDGESHLKVFSRLAAYRSISGNPEARRPSRRRDTNLRVLKLVRSQLLILQLRRQLVDGILSLSLFLWIPRRMAAPWSEEEFLEFENRSVKRVYQQTSHGRSLTNSIPFKVVCSPDTEV